MTILLIAVDLRSTTLRLCINTFSTLGLFSSKKNYVKIVDFGEECAENGTPNQSATIGV